MGLDKSECLRLKGIIEPLEDIIKRHFGNDWYSQNDELYFKSRHKMSDEEILLKDLANALGRLQGVESYQWNSLLHQNDKLDI